ncbi:hypothetical protein Pfo_013331 [Paulownia fortunei]|nr:hypothetical protein Pfo_013331 [Paulownia fortunei]
MDCHIPVDDFCDAWQADNLEIPEKIPTNDDLDQYFIEIQLETTYPQNEEEEEEDYLQVDLESDTVFFTFWQPCPRLERKNVPNERISSMLTEAGVPLHKQEHLVDRISAEADEIANADYNKVLPFSIQPDMDCLEPAADFCDAWQDKNLKIPKKLPTTDDLDLFFIEIQLESTKEHEEKEEEEEEVAGEEEGEEEVAGYLEVGLESDTVFLKFWQPCPRIESKNLPKERISSMLSEAGVPLHKQENMVDHISAVADEIANAAANKGKKVLPMVVMISVVACPCMERWIQKLRLRRNIKKLAFLKPVDDSGSIYALLNINNDSSRKLFLFKFLSINK